MSNPNSNSNRIAPIFLFLAAALLLTICTVQPAHAQTLTTLYSFGAISYDGDFPESTLSMDAQGNLFGTTAGGGKGQAHRCPCGTAFMLSANGVETVVHSFFNASDSDPGQQALGPDGNLYVPTYGTGRRNYNGKIVELMKPHFKKAKVLFNFTKDPGAGEHPVALIPDAQGNVLGAASGGGPNGYGLIFEVTAQGTETVLHNFAGPPTEGVSPRALMSDGKGNFYGTTLYGGSSGNTYLGGTVFQLTPDGTVKTLYNFCSQTNCLDGSVPEGGLFLDSQGNLYGTTFYGGADNSGTVFELTASGVEKVLYSFAGGTDGQYPMAGVVMDASGNLYGTTAYGGVHSYGTVYELTPTGKEIVLYSFYSGPDGVYPWGGFILDGQGNLIGTTAEGGAYGQGTIFKFTP